MKYLYLYVNVSCIIIPLLFSFILKKRFYQEWKYFIPANLFVAFIFLIWDYYFVKWGVWGFNSEYLSGICLNEHLPLEECLFFFCIPYACVFTYFVLREYNPHIFKTKLKINYYIIMMLPCLFVSIFNLEKMYTFSTFGFLFIFLLLCLIKKINLRLITLSYILILPFFFISNGVLTGSFISGEIVWYNDLENLNMRFWTIPYEDVFYGYLLISCNVLVYELIRNFAQDLSR